MKNIIIIASLLLGMPLMAQTKVVKKNAVKAIISESPTRCPRPR